MMQTIKYRDCPFELRYKNLCASWEYTKEKLEVINSEIIKTLDSPHIAIMAAGSYGRYEAGTPSDLDDFIISMPEAEDYKAMQVVKATVEGLKIPLPNKDGVFSVKIPYENILNKLGKEDESTNELAQRLLLLLESVPLYNPELCEKITDEILCKYMELHRDSPQKEAVILMNDLIRFFRYICANYQYKSWHEGEKWVLRNVKLRHSRVVMYAGLLFVILNASKNDYCKDKVSYIKSMLRFTPVERVAAIMLENGHDPNAFLHNYDYYLGKVTQEESRFELFNIEYSERSRNAHFGSLKRSSDAIQEILTDFVFSMRGIWSNKALGYLLF